jgi:hypothetical protein
MLTILKRYKNIVKSVRQGKVVLYIWKKLFFIYI